MNKKDAFKEINMLQDEYIDELIRIINSPDYKNLKAINFTSATGTGKTKMMSKLINKFSDYFFIITTLSKGQLHLQVRNNLIKDCYKNNFIVYGSADYKINSKLDAESIINKIPLMTKCIWLRDEGHIKTNRFDELLLDKCYKVINFSATNQYSDIQCNFTQTMMLRTVHQTNGTPEEAINKLLEIKSIHKNVAKYNPCAIFRCVGGDEKLYDRIIELCNKNKLKHIDITNENFIMSELCEDDNEYDVIINKFKLIEGIDIRRAHVLYMDNQPSNNATTIQAIGRCRRNALLYREDIDILSPENEELLKGTRECYVYYNVEKMKVSTDENGELQMAFCNHISCEALKPNTTIDVVNGQLPNGLFVLELEGETGKFDIKIDEDTGFNIVTPLTRFYDVSINGLKNYVYTYTKKIHIDNIPKLKLITAEKRTDYDTGEIYIRECAPYYRLAETNYLETNVKCTISNDIRQIFKNYKSNYRAELIRLKLDNRCLDELIKRIDYSKYKKEYLKNYVDDYVNTNIKKFGMKQFCHLLSTLGDKTVSIKLGDNLKTYCLNDFCDEYDLLLFQFYYIELKKRKIPNDLLSKPIERFIKLMLVPSSFSVKDNTLTKRLIYTLFDEQYNIYNKKILYSPFEPFFVTRTSNEAIKICEKDITTYFSYIDMLLNNQDYVFISIDGIVSKISEILKNAERSFNNNVIPNVKYSFESLYEKLDNEEEFMIKNNYIKPRFFITQKQLEHYNSYTEYDKIENDKESAIIGVDLMKQIKFMDNLVWIESSSVSTKIGNFDKLNIFLSNKYSHELAQASSQYFSGKNNFKLDKKCNSIIGYCTEYYSKYLVYGKAYLAQFIEQAQKELCSDLINDNIIIRACMLKYKEMMARSFGTRVSKIIKGIPVQQLIQEKYNYFINLVVELGTKTANYVKRTLYSDRPMINNIDPNLSIRHIAGLADYITTDTILDVKVRNYIDETCIRQVLAYHYLSTKRSDLNINRVIVYDAVSDKSVIININKTQEG